MQFGERQIFAVEIGNCWGGSSQLRDVDIWAAGHRLTYYDNCAYLPSFIHALECEINYLSRTNAASDFNIEDYRGNVESLHETCVASEVWDGYRFLDYGATTDGVRAYIFSDHEEFLITFQFRSEQVYSESGNKIFFVTIFKHALLNVLNQAVNYLRLYVSK